MTDIELRNENGKIVGYDSDGNKVPVRFEDGSFDSVSTGVINSIEYVSDDDDLSTRLNNVSSGTKVIVTGTHTVDDSSGVGIELTASDVAIEFHGATIKRADGALSSGSSLGLIRIGDGSATVSNVSLSGDLTIDGNKTNNYSGAGASVIDLGVAKNTSDVSISGIRAINGVGTAIGGFDQGAGAVGDRENISISDVTIDNPDGGIIFDYVSNLHVAGANIRNTDTDEAIEAKVGCRYVNITNFHLDNIGQSAIDVFEDCKHVSISDGTIDGASVDGDFKVGAIEVGSTSGPASRHISISDVTIRGGYYGLRIRSNNSTGIDCQVDSVNIYDPTDDGLDILAGDVSAKNVNVRQAVNGLNARVGNVHLSDCSALYCDGNGAFAGGDNVTFQNCRIGNNNQGAGSSYGIFLQSGTNHIYVQNCLLYDDQGTTTQSDGVLIDTANSDVRIEDNNHWGMSNFAVHNSGCSATVGENN